jgi:hypothetical protein
LIAVELKAPGNRPTERQELVGQAIKIAGGLWDWTDSVVGYCRILRRAGVPLLDGAELRAEAHDRTLATAAARPKAAPKLGRVREVKPSLGRIRRAEALRSRVRF